MKIIPRASPSGSRIRFRRAVPVRRDRRDLRRRFRRAARAALAERKAEMTALLERLAASRVPLSAVDPGEGSVEFLDGTRLRLATRRGRPDRISPAMNKLSKAPDGAVVWLVRAQPSFTGCRFRLWFAAGGGPRPAEIVAKVGPMPY
jgi:hypothetical protein